jgi:CRISPR/Cas system-associated exonuclease Cas4 (RecB family)
LHNDYAWRSSNDKETWGNPDEKYFTYKLENLCYTADMATIRASDIGNYLYCRRAWWYRRQGVPSENQAELTAGSDLHREHGRRVLAAGLTGALAAILFLLGVMVLVAYLTLQML